MKFSEKILYVREKLLVSQEQLAQELGISFATINRWEKGHNEPSFLTRKKFDKFCENKGIKFDN